MKLNRAARLQLPVPVDGRFVARRFSKKAHQNRVLVAEFLAEVYNTIAEPLPERHGGEDDSANRADKNENDDQRVFESTGGEGPKWWPKRAGRRTRQIYECSLQGHIVTT